MFGRPGAPGDLNDPAWSYPALYALECGLTTLWASIGIRPSVVAGFGAGEIAVARTARMFSLEDGLRLAAAVGESDTVASPSGALVRFAGEVALERPSLAVIRGADGRPLSANEAFPTSFWLERDGESDAPAACARTLADRGVEVVLEIGPGRFLAPAIADAWPTSDAETAGDEGTRRTPLALASLRSSSGDAAGDDTCGGFLAAAAAAYEAGLPVSFAGLFAGEERRRISLPGYPFERTRHWVEPPARPR